VAPKDSGEPVMVNGRGKNERRRTRRIRVDLRIKIAGAVYKSEGFWSEQWADVAGLKDISHLGAYFECRGTRQLKLGDILRIDLDVSLPMENRDMDSGERLPMGGLAAVVRTRPLAPEASIEVAVRFLEPLSMKLNSV
jgi:hypothetical protein